MFAKVIELLQRDSKIKFLLKNIPLKVIEISNLLQDSIQLLEGVFFYTMASDKAKIRLFIETLLNQTTERYNAMMFYYYLRLKRKGIFYNFTYKDANKLTGISINSVKKYIKILTDLNLVEFQKNNLILKNEERAINDNHFILLKVYKSLSYETFKNLIFVEIIKFKNSQQLWMIEKKAILHKVSSNQPVYKLKLKEYKELTNSKYSFEQNYSSQMYNSLRQLARLFKRSINWIRTQLLKAIKNGYIKTREVLSLFIKDITYEQSLSVIKHANDLIGRLRYKKGNLYRHDGINIIFTKGLKKVNDVFMINARYYKKVDRSLIVCTFNDLPRKTKAGRMTYKEFRNNKLN